MKIPKDSKGIVTKIGTGRPGRPLLLVLDVWLTQALETFEVSQGRFDIVKDGGVVLCHAADYVDRGIDRPPGCCHTSKALLR